MALHWSPHSSVQQAIFLRVRVSRTTYRKQEALDLQHDRNNILRNDLSFDLLPNEN